MRVGCGESLFGISQLGQKKKEFEMQPAIKQDHKQTTEYINNPSLNLSLNQEMRDTGQFSLHKAKGKLE